MLSLFLFRMETKDRTVIFPQKHEESGLIHALISIRTVLCKGSLLFLVFLRIPKLMDCPVGRKTLLVQATVFTLLTL